MADRTPEETHALALERVVNCLTTGFSALDGPLLGGLDMSHDRDIFDELQRIWDGLRTGSATNPTPTTVWQAVNAGLTTWSWWRNFNYLETETTWEVPGSLEVIAEDPSDDQKTISKVLTAEDLLHAYQAMPNKTHCGGSDLIADPDDCSSDLILQWAMYGEIVYG